MYSQHPALTVGPSGPLGAGSLRSRPDAGRPVASIRTTGSAASRFFAGSRQFEVTDQCGTALFQVHDPMTWGRDRYRVTAPDGSPRPRPASMLR
jgi:hypothetical protein